MSKESGTSGRYEGVEWLTLFFKIELSGFPSRSLPWFSHGSVGGRRNQDIEWWSRKVDDEETFPEVFRMWSLQGHRIWRQPSQVHNCISFPASFPASSLTAAKVIRRVRLGNRNYNLQVNFSQS